MTEENRVRNARAELERAAICLREAETLDGTGLGYGAVSRAYYAVFHAARALLLTAGIEPRSHRGLAGLVGEHFIKPGRLSPEMGRLLSRMQRDREDADYVAGAVFTEADVTDTIAGARRFLDEAGSVVGPPLA